MAAPRILIVDDDLEVIDALRAAFARQPWQVDSATVASVALSKHTKSPYDLLIVDKNLPDLDGVELIRQLRADHDRVRIIVLTGYGSSESAIRSLNLAIDAYLLKPFASVDVQETVEDVLTRPPAASAEQPHLFDVDVEWADQETTAPREGPATRRSKGRPGLATVEEKLFFILVASADPRARARLAATIESKAGEILFAAEVREMMDLVESRPLGLVIIHGALDAAEVVARIRARQPDLPCVVIAEAAALDTVTWLIELRITALLTESLDSEPLVRRLNDIVRNLRERQPQAAMDGALLPG